MFRPDVVVLDYAPTARLAAHALNIPAVLIGSGFELPPPTNPLPPFPGFPWATADAAAASERRVLDNVNAVLRAHRAQPLSALNCLVEAESRFLTTFAELDHYGPRENERYIGPLADHFQGRHIDWPDGSQGRVFAYLRGELPELPSILEGLTAAEVSVVAYVPGISNELKVRFSSPQFVFSAEPVQYVSLFERADVCLSYSPAGTVTAALLHGIPQLMIPVHIESQLTARRVESQGMGRMLLSPTLAAQVTQSLHRLLTARDTRLQARGFAERHRGFSAATAAATVVEATEALCEDGVPHSRPAHAVSSVAAGTLQ
jgi:UDP:flavonoid glycosyltransferase YjiC (YdhE family)